MSQTDVNTQLLIEARDQFFSSVSESDLQIFSKCSSHAEFLADIQKLEIISQQKRRGTKFLKQIQKLSNGLEQYFKVIEMVISSNPEFVAIGWGVFRLILQLANGFVTFFEKLARVLGQIADALPQYQDIMRLFGDQPPERLKSSLCQLYVDFFQFFQGVTRVFTKENGKIKRTPAVIGSLFWKPFDIRFNDLLDQLKYHRELLKDEITIHEYQQAHDSRAAEVEERRKAEDARHAANISHVLCSDIRESQKKAQFDRVTDRMKRWLAPPEFIQEYEQAQSLMEEDTAIWLFDEYKFIQWMSFERSSVCLQAIGSRHFDARVLWVKGNPGCGKTVLASSTVSELRSLEIAEGSNRLLTCFFFFSQTTPNKSSHTGALRAILAQILRQCRGDEAFINKVSFAMNEATGGQNIASQMELVELMELCLMNLPNVSIVLDAIDECEDSDAFINIIQRLCDRSTTKFILFSRPNVSGLRRTVQEQCCLEMDKRSNESDLMLYFGRRIQSLLDDRLLLPSSDAESLIRHLFKGADGMFLWGRLMISYLNSPALIPTQRVSTIKEVNLPEGFDKMYQRILGLILRADKAQQDMARRVFVWLAHARRELDSRELQAALLAGAKIATEHSNYADLNHMVIMSCGSLVEMVEYKNTKVDSMVFRHQKTQLHFKFIHLSVLEFFSIHDQSNSIDHQAFDWLLPTQQQAHLEMLKTCIFYLTYQIPAGPLSGSSSANGHPAPNANYFLLSQTFPFLFYATRSWIHHLFEIILRTKDLVVASTSQQVLSNEQWADILHALATFVANKRLTMAWLEAFYTFPEIEVLEYKKLIQWYAWAKECLRYSIHADLSKDCCRVLEEFSSTLKKLEADWHPTLCKNPCEIWGQVADFSSGQFFESSHSTLVTSIAPTPEDPTKSNLCQTPLTTMSETRANSIETAVLSIWTTQKFETARKTLTASDSYLKLRGFCTGWIARYEIWTVTDNQSSRIFRTSVELDEAEVWLQFRQSVRQDIMNTWKMQLPLAIGDDLRTFSIFRTLFKLSIDEDKKAKIQTVILPMEIHSPKPFNWSDEKLGFGPTLNHHAPLNLRVVTHDLFEYSVKLGPKSQFVALCEAGLIESGFIIIFKLENIAEKFVATPENWARCDVHDRDFTFHPSLPLIAINSWQNVCVWGFLSARQEFMFLKGYEGFKNSVSSPKVTFSECGNHLVLDYPNQRPSIQTLENNSAYKAAVEYSRSKSAQTQDTNPSLDHQNKCSALSTILSSKDGESIRHNAISVKPVSNTMKVRRVGQSHSPGSIELQQYYANDPNGLTESLSLTALPNWPNMNMANIAIGMPEKEGDSIKIVLNKVCARWNSFEEISDSKFPAIIQRDPQSIQPAHIINPTHQELHKDGGLSFADKIMIGEPILISKRKTLAESRALDQSFAPKPSDPEGFQIHRDGKKRKFEKTKLSQSENPE